MLSLFGDPSLRYKKGWFQPDNGEQNEAKFLLKNKRQSLLHGSSADFILKNKQFSQVELDLWPSDIRFRSQSNDIDLSRLKEMWKEIQRSVKLHSWKQIKVLSLTWPFRPTGTSQDSEAIASLFVKTFPDLTTLVLKGVHHQNNSKLGLDLIFNMSRHLLKIKDLSIEFDYKSNAADCIELLASQTLHNLTKLQYLDLNFQGSNTLTALEIDLLCEEINKKASRLCSLTLDFSNCNLNDECMEILGLKLCPKLSDLRQLYLAIGDNQITDQGVMHLSKFMSCSLPNLSCLTLDLFGCELVTADGFEYLGKKIAENLRNLQELSFIFGIHLQPGSEDNEYSDDDGDSSDTEVKKNPEGKSLYQLRIEKETAFRDGIFERLKLLLDFIPHLRLNSEVVLG